MSEAAATAFRAYEQYRLQLAELGLMFSRMADRYPGVFFQFVQGDKAIDRKDWDAWIAANRPTLDEDKESWDAYPPLCFSPDPVDDFLVLGGSGRTGPSQFCGRYTSAIGGLKAARIEMERLAELGTKILVAIWREVERNEELKAIAHVERPDFGYRGWLDGVRNTAEIHRCALLNVETRMWGVPRDIRAEVEAMTLSTNEWRDARKQGMPPPYGVLVSEISPDIFTACGNAIRLWLQGGEPDPIELTYHTFSATRLPATEEPDRALVRVSGSQLIALANLPATRPPKRRRKRGKPPLTPEREALYRGICALRAAEPKTLYGMDELARRAREKFGAEIDEKTCRKAVDWGRKHPG